MKTGRRACHRTVRIDPVTQQIASVPNPGRIVADKPETIRIIYDPDQQDLILRPEDERLALHIGEARVGELRAALVDVSVGGGDYAISPDRKSDGCPLWFWWMPNINYHRGKRM